MGRYDVPSEGRRPLEGPRQPRLDGRRPDRRPARQPPPRPRGHRQQRLVPLVPRRVLHRRNARGRRPLPARRRHLPCPRCRSLAPNSRENGPPRPPRPPPPPPSSSATSPASTTPPSSPPSASCSASSPASSPGPSPSDNPRAPPSRLAPTVKQRPRQHHGDHDQSDAPQINRPVHGPRR